MRALIITTVIYELVTVADNALSCSPFCLFYIKSKFAFTKQNQHRYINVLELPLIKSNFGNLAFEFMTDNK